MRSDPSVGPSPSSESAAPGPAGMPFVGATAWKPWRVMVAFVAAVGLVLLGRVIVSGNGAGPLVGIAIALSLLNVAPVALALLLANLDGRRPTAHDFGLRRAPLGRAAALLFAVGIGLTVLSVLWVEALGLDAEEGQALTDRLGTDGTLKVLILVVILTVLGPLGEEFLFRGYIFGALRNCWGVWPAALAASVLFAATHLGWLPIALLPPWTLDDVGDVTQETLSVAPSELALTQPPNT